MKCVSIKIITILCLLFTNLTVAQTTKMEVGNVFIPHQKIEFVDDYAYKIKASSFLILDSVAQVLQDSLHWKVEVRAHLHSGIGSNMRPVYSKRRARVAMEYLLRKRIHPSRLSYQGMGEEQPLVPDITLENKLRNERIDFKITSTTDTNQFSLQSKQLHINSEYYPQPKIEFDVAKPTLRSNSYPILDSIVTFLKNHHNVFIEIQGHADRVNEMSTSSIMLPQKRAQSVLNYLVQHGISKRKLVAKNYGEEMPLLPNNVKENRTVNRRIVFKVLDIKK